MLRARLSDYFLRRRRSVVRKVRSEVPDRVDSEQLQHKTHAGDKDALEVNRINLSFLLCAVLSEVKSELDLAQVDESTVLHFVLQELKRASLPSNRQLDVR